MAITICSADKIDTTGCMVVARLKADGRVFKKSFRCASDVNLAIKAAVEYEKKIRAKYAKPVVKKQPAMPRLVTRVGKPELELVDSEYFAVCQYVANGGRSRRSRIRVDGLGTDIALEQAESMARKMSMFGRRLKK